MTLAQISESLQLWDECRIVNKEAGELSVIALTRRGKAAALWLVQRDPSYLERVAEAGGPAPPAPPATNREGLSRRPVAPRLPAAGLKAVRLGGREYPVTGSAETQVRGEDWKTVLTLAGFLGAGWTPAALLHANGENLFLSKHDLEGDFAALPPDGAMVLLPEDKLDEATLPCGYTLLFDREQEPRPVSLGDGKTAWLLRPEWFDPWRHLEDTLSHPKITGQFAPKELARLRRRMEEATAGVCPRGMALPVVVYEAEREVSLYFYQRGWLDAPYKPNGSAFLVTGFFKGEGRVGPHGLPLRAAALPEAAQDPRGTEELPLDMVKWVCRRPQQPVQV